MNTNEKQRRYEELCSNVDRGETLSGDELNEQTRLFYELNPDEWASTLAAEEGKVPSDLWPVATQRNGENQ